jgi:hypothetical protein
VSDGVGRIVAVSKRGGGGLISARSKLLSLKAGQNQSIDEIDERNKRITNKWSI